MWATSSNGYDFATTARANTLMVRRSLAYNLPSKNTKQNTD